MNRLLASTITCVVSVTMASVADAQFVRVGPFGGVSVRAPFVSVDTLPMGGGARVRAPFVSINTRAYSFGYRGYPYGYSRYYGQVFYDPVLPRYAPPVYAIPRQPRIVYPQPDSTRVVKPAIDDATVPSLLRASALQLKRSLSLRRDDSDVWLEYLAPDRIVQAIDSSAAPSSLRDLLVHYEGVIGNSSLQSISGSNGFLDTLQLLRSYVNRPADSGAPTTVEGTATEPAAAVANPATAVRPADNGGDQKANQGTEELPLPPPVATPTPL